MLAIEIDTLKPLQSHKALDADPSPKMMAIDDGDTYMFSTMSLLQGSRTQSQGKINITGKDFDAKTLLLPDINPSKVGKTSLVTDYKMPQITYR